MAVGYGTLSLLAIMGALSASSCGDDPKDNNGGNGGNGGTTPPSQIPDTLARGPVSAPSVSQPLLADPDGKAILRHVVRSSVSGDVMPLGNYTASTTGTVERRVSTNVYEEVEAASDGRYLIEPEANNLAYFKVTNVTADGATRVHNFSGVPAGYYMTFDTATNADASNSATSQTECRNVAVRILGLPAEKAEGQRLLINGQVQASPVFEDTRGYVSSVEVCAIDRSGHYLATVVYDDGTDVLRYGFNFYQGIESKNLLELSLNQLAGSATWSADHPINEAYTLSVNTPGWSTPVKVFSPLATEQEKFADSGKYPAFSAIPAGSIRFVSETADADTGTVLLQRDVALDSLSVTFDIDNVKVDDSRLATLDVSWDNGGEDAPDVVTGVHYNGEQQIYAFMSMEPAVLSSSNIEFDINDIALLQGADTLGINLAAGNEANNLHYASRAARQAGFRFWPYPAAANGNLDIAADPVIVSNLKTLLIQSGD